MLVGASIDTINNVKENKDTNVKMNGNDGEEFEEDMLLTVCWMILLLVVPLSDGACTIPQVFKGSTWKDSARGEVMFTTWKMEGWSFRVNGQTINDWVMVDDTKFNADGGGYIAYRSWETFTDSSNKTWYSYLCLKYGKVTDYSYKYHQYHDVEETAGGERVKLHTDDSLSAFEEICDESFLPNVKQFHVMVKKDEEEEAQIDCPNAILAMYDYTLLLQNDSAKCAKSQDSWDGCKDPKRITFNYTSCSAIMLYSAGGKVQCVASSKFTTLNEEHYTYVVVQNLDTHTSIDNIVTFPFSCIATNSDGTEMSVVPGSCTPTQVPYEFPEDADAVRVSKGAKITNKVLHKCQGENQDNDDNDNTQWIITGAVIGGLVVLVLAVICIVRRCKRAK